MLDDEKKEQKNMLVAMVLVIGVLFLFNRFTDKPVPQQQESVQPVVAENTVAPAPVVMETRSALSSFEQTQVAFSNSDIDGEMVILDNGDISVSDLKLKKYKETTEADSPLVSLLSKQYRTSLVWQGFGAFSDPVLSGSTLTPKTPITLTFSNDNAILERTVKIDDQYMITFSDKITNKSGKPLSLALIGSVVRQTDTVPTKTTTVHEGFLGLFNNAEKEERYASIKPDKPMTLDNKGGWIGQTDKYWQTIFIPAQSDMAKMTFEQKGQDYISSFNAPVVVAAGQTMERTTQLFAGAKELEVIQSYQEQGVPRFELSIDFGWYYFLTKPFLYILGWLYAIIGNMGVVILVFATFIRILLLPIAKKSYESMAKMKKIQPKIKDLQERFKDNKQQLQIEMMNLYKRDKVNPASGCLPMFIQIPVFFALYKVLSLSILMRQAPFFGWIQDLSQPDPSSVLTAFGYLPWPIPSFLDLGVWPILMGLTMVVQQRLNPSTAMTKEQKVMMNFMPIIFTFMLGNFASGLVIYWTWSNLLSIAQQRYIMKKVGV